DVRENIVIGTKFGYDFESQGGKREGHKELPQDFSPAFVRRACEASLERLRTDYIDIYQLHNPRLPAIQSDELFQTLEELKSEGKIRHYAAAIGPDIGWEDEGIASMRRPGIVSAQIIYSVLEQEPARTFFPVAKETDTALLSRVPHASGLLDGTYTPGMTFDSSDHRAHRKREWLEESLRKVANLEPFYGGSTGRTIGQAAIQFVLLEPTIACVLPNFLNEDQLDEFVGALDAPSISEADVATLKDLYDRGFYLESPAPSSA
ncbi:MAG: aldo/keto reductase, partial [Dehalococcoidia bacterium]